MPVLSRNWSVIRTFVALSSLGMLFLPDELCRMCHSTCAGRAGPRSSGAESSRVFVRLIVLPAHDRVGRTFPPVVVSSVDGWRKGSGDLLLRPRRPRSASPFLGRRDRVPLSTAQRIGAGRARLLLPARPRDREEERAPLGTGPMAPVSLENGV